MVGYILQHNIQALNKLYNKFFVEIVDRCHSSFTYQMGLYYYISFVLSRVPACHITIFSFFCLEFILYFAYITFGLRCQRKRIKIRRRKGFLRRHSHTLIRVSRLSSDNLGSYVCFHFGFYDSFLRMRFDD